MRCIVFILAMAFLHSDVSASADTVSLYFSKRSRELNDASIRTIDSLIYHDIIVNERRIAVIGYYSGNSDGHNSPQMPKKRVDLVASYMVKMGISEASIQCIVVQGKRYGKTANKSARSEAAKVDIIPGGIDDSVYNLMRDDRSSKSDIVNTAETTMPPENRKTGRKKKPKINLAKVKINEAISLDINFAGGTDIVLNESIPTLLELTDIMKQHPALKICLEGHVCCILQQQQYDRQYSQSSGDELSTKRARAVHDFLVQRGIDTTRIQFIGFGFSKPLTYPEKNAADRMRNRRVEVRVIQK